MADGLEMAAGVAEVPERRTSLGALRDLFALGKPRLSALVLFTTAGGIWLAPGTIELWRAALALVLTTLAVSSANTLNCYIERETDALMKRTRGRPLPAGRLPPNVALVVGIVSALVSVPGLVWAVNPLAGALGATAILSYVAVYTPMKYRSPWAVIVGSLPGAIPPLLGWTAVTGRMDAMGLALFAVLFVWQVPHFFGIALYLKDDYAKAGIRALPLTHGDRATWAWTLATAFLMLPVSLLLVPLAGWGYGVAATVLGLWLTFRAWQGRAAPTAKWGRQVMLASITYLTLLFVALGIGAA